MTLGGCFVGRLADAAVADATTEIAGNLVAKIVVGVKVVAIAVFKERADEPPGCNSRTVNRGLRLWSVESAAGSSNNPRLRRTRLHVRPRGKPARGTCGWRGRLADLSASGSTAATEQPPPRPTHKTPHNLLLRGSSRGNEENPVKPYWEKLPTGKSGVPWAGGGSDWA